MSQNKIAHNNGDDDDDDDNNNATLWAEVNQSLIKL